MVRRPVTWIVTADGSRARILRPRTGVAGFDVLVELSEPEARRPSREIWAGRPGRVQESANSARHAIEPRQDPHLARESAFVRSLAEHINQAGRERAFDRLVLFAPARWLAELRGALDPSVRERIAAAVAKDLVKLPLIDLPRHLENL